MPDTNSLSMPAGTQSVAEGNAGVTSAHPLATKAGIECLQAGGNAFDALVATAITLVVVEPMMSGILGVGLAMIHSRKQGSRVCNFSGRVPERFSPQEWDKDKADALSIVAPQALQGWLAIHDEYGKLPFEALFGRAIEHAEKGIELTEANCYFLNFAKNLAPQNMQFDYYKAQSYEVGDRLKQAKTAKALRILAKNPQAITQGQIADAIQQTAMDHECAVTLTDLKSNSISWQSPLVAEVFGRRVAVPPPNSDAFIILQAARLLEEASIHTLQHNSAEYVDLVVGVLKRVLEGSHDWGGDPLKAKSGFSFSKQHTTTLLAHDEQGNSAVMTQTLGGFFGSGIWVEEYGLPFNGVGSYFFDTNKQALASRQATPCGQVPWSVSLVQVFDGDRLEYAFGTPGGVTIQQTELQVLLNLLVFKMPLADAIDAPRFFVDEREDITLEGRFTADVVASLSDKGYQPKCLGDYSWMLGCMQGLACAETTTFVGDVRRHAAAMAY